MTCLDFCILVTIITILPSFIVFLCKLNYQSIKLGSQDSSVHIVIRLSARKPGLNSQQGQCDGIFSLWE